MCQKNFSKNPKCEISWLVGLALSVWQNELTDRFEEAGSNFMQMNLITVQQDATYSVYYFSVGSSTCFECRHPSSGARTTVITASGID